jgi:hypothetical protein
VAHGMAARVFKYKESRPCDFILGINISAENGCETPEGTVPVSRVGSNYFRNLRLLITFVYERLLLRRGNTIGIPALESNGKSLNVDAETQSLLNRGNI